MLEVKGRMRVRREAQQDNAWNDGCRILIMSGFGYGAIPVLMLGMLC